MINRPGWEPLRKQTSAASVNSRLTLSPFGRLARTHAMGAAGDGAVALALAGSIFFSISPSAARTSIALYLLLTIAPFAVVTPLIGPMIDRVRGGRRIMIVATFLGRAVAAVLMALYVDSLLLFPLAFALLVLQKTYAVAKSALVPGLVRGHDELVEANSKLALLSTVAGMAGIIMGSLFGLLAGPAFAAALAAVVYLVGMIQSLTVPKIVVASEGPEAVEIEEVRGAMIQVSAIATGLLRLFIGFVTFLLAFEIRGADEGVDLALEGSAVGAGTAVLTGRDLMDVVRDPPAPFWHFGVVAAAAAAGALVGASMAPILRRRLREEYILLGALLMPFIGGLTAAIVGGIWGAFFMALGVTVGASAGKLAFDSLVQRDAPDANYGRWFARFEARFQLAWVAGAFIPVLIHFGGDDGARAGYAVLATMAGVAAVLYLALTRPRFQHRLRRFAPAPVAADGASPDRNSAATADGADGVDPTGPVGPAAVEPEAPTAALDEVAADPQTLPFGADQAPSARPLWSDEERPVVSSVDGVEVDEPE